MADNENTNECCCTTPEYTINLSQQGPQGLTGEPGADGFSPVVDVYQDEPGIYKLAITSAENTIVTPNLKGESIPLGGDEGMVLTKRSSDNLDASWQSLPMGTEANPGIVEVATVEEIWQGDEDTVVSPYGLSQTAILSAMVRNAVVMSEAGYEALTPKVATTLYLIPEEG